ncbi:MAG: 50S ribosomal protein L25 [Anaerolineales bacterium]|nr:50S ribosomal protein L25 [Anaerolineales bacterium]
MEAVTLNAKVRKTIRKRVKALRRQGFLPAVMYGVGVEPIPIELDDKEASRVLARVSGSTLIDLKVGKDTHKVLVREFQRDVIRRNILHVDFLVVAMDVAIRAVVPVILVGEAPAVEDFSGIIVSGLTEIEVEALPVDLPEQLSVDIEVLATMNDVITAGDLVLGDGVALVTDPDEMIANVIAQMAEEEVEEVEVEELEEGVEPEMVDGEEEVEEEAEESPKREWE